MIIPSYPKYRIPISALSFTSLQLSSDYIVFCSKHKLSKIPLFITPELAYYVGYLQGDGCIESNGRRINFTDEYKEQIDRINFITWKLFGIMGRIEARKSKFSKKFMYRLEVGSIVLNDFLHHVFGICRGVKRSLNIPIYVFHDKELMKWYLRGLFDADGTLPKFPEICKQHFVDITFKDKNFINQIKGVLQSFDINTLGPTKRRSKSPNSEYISITWDLQIRKRCDIINFLNTMGFSHPIKLKRARQLLCLLGQ